MNGENCKKMRFLKFRNIMFPWKLNNEFRDGSVSTNGMVGIGNGVTKTYLIRNIILVLVGVSNIFRWKPNLVCGKSPANISEYSTLFFGVTHDDDVGARLYQYFGTKKSPVIAVDSFWRYWKSNGEPGRLLIP